MIKAPPKLAARLRGRVNKIRGDQAQLLVAHRLRQMGFQCVVALETGWRVQRVGGKIIGATPLAKVTGDFRAVGGMGQSVLVEAKRRDGNLRLSDFATHSQKALTDHAAAGGASLVAWVSAKGVAIFPWLAFIECGRRSIDWATAVGVGLTTPAPVLRIT